MATSSNRRVGQSFNLDIKILVLDKFNKIYKRLTSRKRERERERERERVYFKS